MLVVMPSRLEPRCYIIRSWLQRAVGNIGCRKLRNLASYTGNFLIPCGALRCPGASPGNLLTVCRKFKIFFFFFETGSQCSSGWPGACYVEQADLKLWSTYLYLLSARIKGKHHSAPVWIELIKRYNAFPQ